MTKRALLYGDSNTFGTMPMETLASDGIYPKGERWGDHLAAGLGADWDVVIEGLPGRTSAFEDPLEGSYLNGRPVLKPILLSHRPIDVLVIALGTNDQKHRFGLRAMDIALGIAGLVQDAFATGVVSKVLAIAPPPLMLVHDFGDVFHGVEERVAGLSGWIERFAQESGAAFFDAGTVIDVDPLDGIHWSAEAHAALGQALVEVVRELG